jgi:hypothetical protein
MFGLDMGRHGSGKLEYKMVYEWKY